MKFRCPYCGNEVEEEKARAAGCCGEKHCEEVDDDFDAEPEKETQ